MSAINELYQELIVDHGRKPRNFLQNDAANHIKQGFNRLCGDKITLYVVEKNGKIENATFQGCGCAIAMASASLMTEAIRGKTLQEAQELFTAFHDLVTKQQVADTEYLGKLIALSGVGEFPARVKCATLAWHVLLAALQDDHAVVSTE